MYANYVIVASFVCFYVKYQFSQKKTSKKLRENSEMETIDKRKATI